MVDHPFVVLGTLVPVRGHPDQLFDPIPEQSWVPRLLRLQRWDSSPSKGDGRKLTRYFLFFNANAIWEYSWFAIFACHQYTTTWFYCDMWVYTAYLFFFGLFYARGYCRISSKVPCADHQVFVEYLLDIHISEQMWQEWRKGIILVNCLLRI